MDAKNMTQQQPQPQFIPGDLGDLSWVGGMIDWLGSRNILPAWVVELIQFVLRVFAPQTRSRMAADPQIAKDVADLQQTWASYQSGHPNALSRVAAIAQLMGRRSGDPRR